MPSHWRSKGSNGRRDDGRQKNRQKKAPQKDGEGDTASFSAYGTTKVNILTVNPPTAQRKQTLFALRYYLKVPTKHCLSTIEQIINA